MNEYLLYHIALGTILGIAFLVAITLFFTTAPYGRYTRAGWGPTISSTLGWVIMETPAVVVMGIFFAISERLNDWVCIIFLLLWESHYLYRAFIFPFRRRGGHKPMPLSVVAMALVFNIYNGYLNGFWLFTLGPERQLAWLGDIRFVIGVALFFAGMIINRHSDAILLGLRQPAETGYKIPEGGLFRYLSSPNYFGELLQWIGWAICTWSLAGLSFAMFTAANLVPRAWSNHKWYRERFPDYPPERRAIIPFIF